MPPLCTRRRPFSARALTAGAGLLTLTACAEPYTVSETRCDLSRHNALLGRNVAELILPDRLELAEVWPGDTVDPNIRPFRLTLFTDAKGFVTRAACR